MDSGKLHTVLRRIRNTLYTRAHVRLVRARVMVCVKRVSAVRPIFFFFGQRCLRQPIQYSSHTTRRWWWVVGLSEKFQIRPQRDVSSHDAFIYRWSFARRPRAYNIYVRSHSSPTARSGGAIDANDLTCSAAAAAAATDDRSHTKSVRLNLNNKYSILNSISRYFTIL